MITSIIKKIFALPRNVKRVVQIISDCTIICICFWVAFALRLDGIFTEINPASWLAIVATIPITIFAFTKLGLYTSVVRFMAEKAVGYIILGAFFSSIILFSIAQIFGLFVPRSVPLIYFLVLVFSIGGSRLLMRLLYISSKSGREEIVIYGAGEAGRLLMQALQYSAQFKLLLFIDDDKNIQGSTIAGTPVLSFDEAAEKIAKRNVSTALIAFKNIAPENYRRVAMRMIDLGLQVRSIPNVADLVSGKVELSTLKKLQIKDLLGRDTVVADPVLMTKTTTEKSILVTGAGGSIGSELCRQVFKQRPCRIVLFDVSEYSLYSILEEFSEASEYLKHEVELVPVLGTVLNRELVERTLVNNSVHTIYHAAAYKHVPLVENNTIEAVRNNALGTQILAEAAGRLGVEHFSLISTDKAVRPTNVMGATKRLAELTVANAAKKHPGTKFCAVRFGNVLGSSGSVIPKFEKQILKGGPMTLTHPEITRYFMTIPEAAQLVIQASALAEDEEYNVFVLDMGKPLKILDLAKTMCTLHGRQLHYDPNTKPTPNAIKLEITGLRPGEKLYEELLLTGREKNTIHPKIKRESSNYRVELETQTIIDRLLALNSDSEVVKTLAALPIEYRIDKLHWADDKVS